MTDVGRMSVGELVGKVMADEHADVLRQAVAWLPYCSVSDSTPNCSVSGSTRNGW
jgi:hypothetical protein